MDETTLEEMKPLLRPLFAGLRMLGELITDGVPGEACDALVDASIKSGRTVEDQMAFNAVELSDALLRALDEPPPHKPRLTTDEEDQLAAFPSFLATLMTIRDDPKSDEFAKRAAAGAIEEYDNPMPF